MEFDIKEETTKTFIDIIEKQYVLAEKIEEIQANLIPQIQKKLIPLVPNFTFQLIKEQTKIGMEFYKPFSSDIALLYSFKPEIDDINQIINLPEYSYEKDSLVHAYYSSYILHYFLFWSVLLVQKDEQIISFDPLFFFLTSFTPHKEYIHLFTSSFFILISMFISERPSVDDFTSKLDIIFDYWINNFAILPQYKDSFLVLIFKYSTESSKYANKFGQEKLIFPKAAIEVGNKIIMLINHNIQISNSSINLIFNNLQNFLLQNDLNALIFFSEICHLIDMKVIYSIIPSFPVLSWARVKDFYKINCSEKEELENDENGDNIEILDKVTIPEIENLEQHIYTPKIEDYTNYTDICPDYFKEYIKPLTKILLIQSEYFNLFSVNISTLFKQFKDDPAILSLINIFITILMECFNQNHPPHKEEILQILQSPLFDKKISFSNNNNILVDKARYFTLLLAFNIGDVSCLSDIFIKFSQFPKLYVDSIEKICLFIKHLLDYKIGIFNSFAESFQKIYMTNSLSMKASFFHLLVEISHIDKTVLHSVFQLESFCSMIFCFLENESTFYTIFDEFICPYFEQKVDSDPFTNYFLNYFKKLASMTNTNSNYIKAKGFLNAILHSSFPKNETNNDEEVPSILQNGENDYEQSPTFNDSKSDIQSSSESRSEPLESDVFEKKFQSVDIFNRKNNDNSYVSDYYSRSSIYKKELIFPIHIIDQILGSYFDGIFKFHSGNIEYIKDACQYVIDISTFSKPSEELTLSFQNILKGSNLEFSSFLELQMIFFDNDKKANKTIKHIPIYKMLVSVFFKHFPEEIADYVLDLCKISDINCVASHDAEIDLLFIEKLCEERLNNSSLEDSLVKKLLQNIYKIGIVIASPIIVNRFISLFIIYDQTTVSKYYDKYLETLFNFINNNLIVPKETIPLKQDVAVSIRKFTNFNPLLGYTFTSWVYVDIPFKFRLFSIINGIQQNSPYACSLFVFKNEVKWVINQGNDNFVVSLHEDIPIKKWFFLSFTYQEDGNIQLNINRETVFDSSKVPTNVQKISLNIKSFYIKCGGIFSKHSQMQAQLKPSNENYYDSKKKGMIGSFGFFKPLDIQTILMIFKLGPRNNENLPDILHGFVYDYKSSKQIRNLLANERSTVIYNNSFFHLSFAQILLQVYSIELLLPLFAQTEMRPNKDDIPKIDFLQENRISLIIGMLKSSIDSDEEVANTFLTIKGFDIILHLLLSSNLHNFHINAYLLFYHMYISLTNENLKKELLTKILFNFQLWSNNLEQLLKIVSHWQTDLFASKNINFVLENIPFERFINLMRIYLFYQPIEQDLIYIQQNSLIDSNTNNEEDPINQKESNLKLDFYSNPKTFDLIKKIRYTCLNILCTYYFPKMTENNFLVLLEHILTCRDYQQSCDFLHFLDCNFLKIQSDNLYYFDTKQCLTVLLNLFLSSNDVLQSEIINLIIHLHKSNHIHSVTLAQQFEILYRGICYNTEKLQTLYLIIFQHITTTPIPEAFGFFVFLLYTFYKSSILSHTEAIHKISGLIEELHYCPNINSPSNWCFWFIIFAIEEKEVRPIIFTYLLTYNPKNWKLIYSLLCYTLFILDIKDKEEIRCDFVLSILNNKTKNMLEAKEQLSDFFDIMYNFIFFRYERYNSLLFQEINNEKGTFNIDFTDVQSNQIHKGELISQVPDNIDDLDIGELVSFDILKFWDVFIEKNIWPGKMKSDNINKESLFLNSNPEDFKLWFGIRFKDGKWVDEKLAETVVSLLFSLELEAFADLFFLLIGFIKRYHNYTTNQTPNQPIPEKQNEVHVNTIASVNDEKVQISAPLDQKHLFSTDDNDSIEDIIQFESSYQLYIEYFPDSPSELRNFAKYNLYSSTGIIPLSIDSLLYQVQDMKDSLIQYIQKYKMFVANCYKIAVSNFSYDLTLIGNSAAKEEKIQIEKEEEKGRTQWNKIWSHMTIEAAPWNPATNSEKHYKRSAILTSNYCPIILKKNNHFDIHKEASELRDSGETPDNVRDTKKKKKNLHPLAILDDDDIDEAEQEEPSQDPPIQNKQGTLFANTLRLRKPENQVVLETECELITIKGNRNGKFLIIEESSLQIVLDNKKTITIKPIDITDIMLRRKIHMETAIEIFLCNGKSYFINFLNTKGLTVIKRIRRCFNVLIGKCQILPSFLEFFSHTEYQKQWTQGQMSNFEYLMKLNVYSGRSFNDAGLYPLIPWIISKFDAETLDLNDPAFFRDLSKPVGAIGEERLETLLQRLSDLAQFGLSAFLYSSYLITPLSLYIYLMRVEPFTSLHIEMQGGRFDSPARLFLSVAKSYKSVTSQVNDYRELIPEFFFMPEFLMNIDHYDLGKIEGRQVNDVELPKWAKSPMDFVYKMRKALECKHVSENLHKWIDLIWGYKQRGQEAVDANNLYKEEMYDTIWEKKKQENNDIEENPESLRMKQYLKINEIEQMINLVGQIPPQLFTEPHPKKKINIKPMSLQTTEIYSSNSPCIYSFIEETKETKCTIIYMNDKSFTRIQFNFEDSKLSISDTKNIPFIKDFSISKQSDIVLLGDNRYVAALSNNLDAFVFMPTNGSFSVIPPHNSISKHHITAISAENGWLAIARDDARVHIYKHSRLINEAANIPSFRNRINCCDISDNFNIVAFGTTSDNTIILSSLSAFKVIRVIQLEDIIPIKVIITKSWGFLVVYGSYVSEGKKKYIMNVYNINGLLIRSIPLYFEISILRSVISKSGFDFILMSSKNGNVYFFEAYYCKIGQPIIQDSAGLLCLHYLHESNLVFCVSPTKTYFIPYVIDDTYIE